MPLREEGDANVDLGQKRTHNSLTSARKKL